MSSAIASATGERASVRFMLVARPWAATTSSRAARLVAVGLILFDRFDSRHARFLAGGVRRASIPLHSRMPDHGAKRNGSPSDPDRPARGTPFAPSFWQTKRPAA